MKTSQLSKSDYSAFYQGYIDTLGDADLLETMQRQVHNFPQFIQSIPDNRWQYAYGPDKWTVAEALLHVIDTERIFQYRALRIARGDNTPLPGFDQDAYVPNSGAARRSKESILEEYQAVRASTLCLFKSFGEEQLLLRGTASNALVSVGAIGFIICGHQRHHRNIIRERYLQTQS